jgi:hypothetical protein
MRKTAVRLRQQRTLLEYALLALALSCFACRPDPYPLEKLPPVHQAGVVHLAILGRAADFFCSRGRWPNSLSEIDQYSRTSGFDNEDPIRWRWILVEDIRYSTNGKAEIVSRHEFEGGIPIRLRTAFGEPGCDGSHAEWRGLELDRP